jgi:anthranilate synthase component 1
LLQSLSHTPITSKRKKLTSKEVIRHFPKESFLSAVSKAKEYIAEGEVMQVVIGQSLAKPFEGCPLTLYRALRSINPSPYMYYYDVGTFQVVGASPEILVRQDWNEKDKEKSSKVTIRPIAGTRPRGKDEEEDDKNEDELKNDPKECAEHVMLIDLARNDIGRIAQSGSVKLTEKMVIERYSHVMHLVSEVEGLLMPDLSFMDVLRATFPAGTLSGAPKIRAMEIIDELEPVKRGLYGGACGYLSFSGEMDLAITIRTGILKDGLLTVQAGAGIVADSVPENEWLESEQKAMAVLRAAEMVEKNMQ